MNYTGYRVYDDDYGGFLELSRLCSIVNGTNGNLTKDFNTYGYKLTSLKTANGDIAFNTIDDCPSFLNLSHLLGGIPAFYAVGIGSDVANKFMVDGKSIPSTIAKKGTSPLPDRESLYSLDLFDYDDIANFHVFYDNEGMYSNLMTLFTDPFDNDTNTNDVGYIRYSENRLWVKHKVNEDWLEVPDSYRCSVIIIDIVGGGGAGAAGYIGSVYDYSGSGGGGGEFLSVAVDLTQVDHLRLTRGKGSTSSRGSVNVRADNANSHIAVYYPTVNRYDTIITVNGGYCGASGDELSGGPGGGTGGSNNVSALDTFPDLAWCKFIYHASGGNGGMSGDSSWSDNHAGGAGSDPGTGTLPIKGMNDPWNRYKHPCTGGDPGNTDTKIYDNISAGGGGGASFLSSGTGGKPGATVVPNTDRFDLGFGGGGGGGCAYEKINGSENSESGYNGDKGSILIWYEQAV